MTPSQQAGHVAVQPDDLVPRRPLRDFDPSASSSPHPLSHEHTDPPFPSYDGRAQALHVQDHEIVEDNERADRLMSPPVSDYEQIKPVEGSVVGLEIVNFTPEPSRPPTADAPRPQLKQPSLFEMVQEQTQLHAPSALSQGGVREPDGVVSAALMPAAAVAQERILLASYSTGGVGYFMYSDQSIEAEMAIGRYRFQSMDELRRFIETQEGGEKISG